MNRIIKFRVWNISLKAFVDFEVKFKSDRIVNNYDNFIFQQFTGLYDKDGKEIYEGDIVKCRAFSTFETVVIEDIRKIPVQVSAWPIVYGKNNGECEIIGNIFENSDLLKK